MKTVLKQIDKIKKGQFKSVYAITGTEQMLIEEVTESLTETIKGKQQDDMNILHFDLNETSVDDVVFEAESFPFFGGQKLIFVHSSYIFTGKKVSSTVKHSTELLENYLNDPSDFSILVFIAPYDKLDKRKKITKTLLKTAEVIDVSPASDKETADYLQNLFQKP
ncbi:MAG: DNA polymerase III subunit delta [Alkalibacterium sp.]|nr:DNA polymerase III subunit delta [Alkalibacterium sp.]